MTLDELQQLIDRMYSSKDQARGVEGTFMWLMEEIGELAAALRESPKEDIAKEFADSQSEGLWGCEDVVTRGRRPGHTKVT